MDTQNQPSEKLLDRFLAGECSPAEKKQVEEWIAENPARASRFSKLPDLLVAQHDRRNWNVDKAYSKVDVRIRESNRKIDITPAVQIFTAPWAHWRTLAIAAVALLAIASAMTITTSRRSNASAASIEWTETKTGPGETRELKLADGSVIKLGPMTTVRHASRSGAVDVEMHGLAGFEVTHDPKRTFKVRAGGAQVIDIGTSFFVRAYSGDSVAMVVVTSGKVALTALKGTPGPASSMELSPGEGGVVLPDGTIIPGAPIGAEISTYLGRLDGRLSFDALDMNAVAEDIGVWFGVRVVIADAALANRNITAVFNKPTLSEVLDAIAETTGSRYETKNGVITFRAGSTR
jgi:ferric-dicitrate binding protein FerR (iron transport regulator)